MIGVGGTKLVKSSSAARGWTEGAWTSAGSSCSTLTGKPSFQNQTACAKRAASDVSAVADPNTGLAVYNAASGGWIVVGGTSASSPYCCHNSWDSTCVSEVASICHQSCSGGGGSCAHAVCASGSALTASCDACAGKVCAADSFCCNVSWDLQCVGEVSSVCHQSCN